MICFGSIEKVIRRMGSKFARCVLKRVRGLLNFDVQFGHSEDAKNVVRDADDTIWTKFR
jgi:hypothetical protein